MSTPRKLEDKPQSRPRRRTHLERTELSERSMLDATELLILELGTVKTTLKEVGEKAGYSRGLANSRFGNKETLFLKLAGRCRETWLSELQLASGSKTGLSAFLSRFDAIISFVENHPNEAKVMYILWFESVGSASEMKAGLERFHKEARKDISRQIQEALAAGEIAQDVDPDDFAILLTSAFFGLTYQWLVSPNLLDIRQQISAIKLQMLHVLRPTLAPE